MHFLADENFPGGAVAALRALGHDVVWIRAVAAGADDRHVLSLAANERRILLTFDKDFGELAGHTILPIECGVVLIRLKAPRSIARSRRLVEIISGRDDWAGHFSVIEPGRVRMRSFR